MDSTTITAWAAMATAIAACVGPALTAYIHAKADLKMKHMELFHSRFDPAVSEFVEAYSELGCNGTTIIDFKQKALALMACVENKASRNAIMLLVEEVVQNDLETTPSSDEKMVNVIDSLTKSL